MLLDFDFDEAIKLVRDIKRNLQQAQAKKKQQQRVRRLDWVNKVPKYDWEKIRKQICWGVGWVLVASFLVGMVIIYPLTLCNLFG